MYRRSSKSVFASIVVVQLVMISFLMITASMSRPVEASFTSPSFSGQKAFQHLENQMSFGFRIPESQGHQECRNYIISNLRSLGIEVSYQNFTGEKGDGEGVNFKNLIGVLKANETTDQDVILAAHYDTRPFTDHDITKAPIEPNYAEPVPGANDGASGVAALIELARVMKAYNRTHNLIFFFTDGEDYGRDAGSMFYGAKYYASQMTTEEIANTKFLILLDMMGDKELTIYREKNSNKKMMDGIWAKAKELGYSQFINADKYAMLDDHIPFKDKDIKVVDLIDFDYPNMDMNYWHTPEDTLDKVSAPSLEAVGRTVESYLVDEIVNLPAANGNDTNNTTPPPPPPPKPPKDDDGFIPTFGEVLLLATIATLVILRYKDKKN